MTLQEGRPSAAGGAPDVVVDLNADVGESFGRWSLGDDGALLPLLTSANVACGFHAGDPLTLRRTCERAAAHGVAVGAQVGYRDLAGFGRRFIDVATDELAADVLFQIGALQAIARAAGTRVGYVKPHGALYHAVSTHSAQAAAVLDGVRAAGPGEGGDLAVLGLAGSPFLDAVSGAGLPAVAEGFADRGYRADGTLVPRSEPGALLTDPAQVAEQALALARGGRVRSICLHGDTPGAPAIARAVRDALAGAGVGVAAFV